MCFSKTIRVLRYTAFALAATLACVSSGFAQQHEPLTLIHTTPLPDITGDFDHFAVDLQHNHLFVSAEVHHSLEMFDLKTGEHLKSIPGVEVPHTLAYIPAKNEIWIGDGGSSAVVILDGTDFHEVGRVPVSADPDAGLYDATNHLFYIGSGGRGAKEEFSTLTIISTETKEKVGEIPLEANNLESMAIDPMTGRLFVNMRDKKVVGVVDLKTRVLATTWQISGLNLNTPLTFDARTKRVFLAGRKPGKFYALDSDTGKVITEQSCVDIADDMTWDPMMKRVYITGSQGVSVFKQISADNYRKLAEFPTNGGKTSVYVPQLSQFYVIHTKTDVDGAALQVFHVNR